MRVNAGRWETAGTGGELRLAGLGRGVVVVMMPDLACCCCCC